MMKEDNLDILMTFEKANVFVDYYWDNHGKEINWNEYAEKPTVWTKAKIEQLCYNSVKKAKNHVISD